METKTVTFQLVRSAYIQSLARFTMLNVSSGFSEIKPKNLEAIKTLITIAFNDCNYLEESWYDVSVYMKHIELICISCANLT